MGLEDNTQIVRQSHKCLSLLSHSDGPRFVFETGFHLPQTGFKVVIDIQLRVILNLESFSLHLPSTETLCV